MKVIYIFSLCLFLLGCDEKYTPQLLIEREPPSQITSTNQFTLNLIDSLNIRLPKGIPPYFEYADHMQNDSLYYFIYENFKIAKIDLKNGSIDTILIPKEVITGNIFAMHVINDNSILIAQDRPNSILLFTEKESHVYKLPKINFKTTNEAFHRFSLSLQEDQANFLIDYRNLVYDANHNTIHLGLQPYDAYDSEGFEDSERVAVFNLNTKKWDMKYAPPEGMMKHRGINTYSYQMSTKNMLLKNDTMFVSYANDHNVYYYHDGTYLGKFLHASANSKQLFLPLDKKRMEDIEEIKQYMGAAPKYSGFYYHQESNLYSRLYFDEQEPFYEDGKYKPSNLYRDVYAIFLDENFNHVGEFKFPHGSVDLLGAKALTDGFALFSTSYNDIDTLDTTFKLKYIYKIKTTN